MKFLFIFFILFLSLSLVSAYFEITCVDEEIGSGFKMWDVRNLPEQNRTLIEDMIKINPEFSNCTFREEISEQMSFEECKTHFTPVINVLNNNIYGKNNEIKRLKKLQYFTYIFLFVIVIFVIREFIYWKKLKGEKIK